MALEFIETVDTFQNTPYFPSQPDNDGFFETFGKSLVRGFLNVGKGLVGTAEEAIELLPGVGEENYLTGVRQNIEKEAKRWEVTPDSAMEWGASVLGEALPYMGSALTGGMYAGILGSSAVAFAVEGQDAYDAAKARGASETEANLERGITGAVNAAIEAWQIGRIMSFGKAGTSSLKAFKEAAKTKAFGKMIAEGGKFTGMMLRNSIEESLEESLQEGVSIAAPYLVEGREALPLRDDGSVDTGAILDRIGQAALAGAVISPFLGAAKAFVPAMIAPNTSSFDKMRSSIENTPGKSDEWKQAHIRDLDIQIEKITGEPGTAPTNQFRQHLEELAIRVEESDAAGYRADSEETISKRRGAKLQEAAEWAKANSPLVDSGQMTREEFGATYATLLEGRLTPEFDMHITNDMDASFQDAIRHTIDPGSFQFIEAQAAWNKLTRQLVLPEESEIKALEPVVGRDIVNKFLGIVERHRKSKRGLGGKIVDNLTEITNFPRATIASMDMSFIGLQGAKVAVRHPVMALKAVAAGWKSFLNEENLTFHELQHRSHPDFDFIHNTMKVKYYEPGGKGTDERFVSKLAHKIPGISASERGWVGSANELRMQLALQMRDKFRSSNLTNKEWIEIGSAINHLTGWGDSKSLKKLMPILNFAFFSPRNNIANAQIYADMNPWSIVQNRGMSPAQKMIAGTLVADAVFAVGILYLLSQIKGVEVERNPLSTDFGKIKIGDTRFEFFGNEHRIIRMVSQLLTGKRKTQAGEFTDVDTVDIITKYFQSKASPTVGFVADMLKGQDFLGRPLNGTTEDVMTQVFERFTPLFIQDMTDYIQYNGLDMDITYATPLAFHGITTLTYPESKSSQLTLYKNKKSKEFFGKKWDDISPEAQKMLRLFEPNIEELELQSNQERGNKAVRTKFLKEQCLSEKRLFHSLPNNIQSELNKLLVDIGGLNRTIADGWHLNDQRYAEYQKRVSDMMKETLPLYLSLDMDPLWKRMLIEDAVDNIKELVRRDIVFKANINDFAKG